MPQGGTWSRRSWMLHSSGRQSPRSSSPVPRPQRMSAAVDLSLPVSMLPIPDCPVPETAPERLGRAASELSSIPGMPNLLRSAKLATIPELDRVSLVGCVEPPEDTLFLALAARPSRGSALLFHGYCCLQCAKMPRPENMQQAHIYIYIYTYTYTSRYRYIYIYIYINRHIYIYT